MRTIVIAASKGGTGKTTLAAALSALAAKTGNVGIADLDPEQSLARWHELRGHFHADLALPSLYAAETAEEVAAQAEKDGVDLLFIDTPPAIISLIVPAISQATLVLVPVRPSLLDLEAVDPILEICRDYEKSFVFLLSMTGDAGIEDESRAYLAHDGKVLAGSIPHRPAFVTTMTKGGTAADADDGGAAAEIENLLRVLQAELQSTHPVIELGNMPGHENVKTEENG
jgi:chromosome partitioning protein